MGCFDNYLDATIYAKTIRGGGITLLLLHVPQCILFNQMKVVTATPISKAWLKSFYSRVGSETIKDFAASPDFEEARKQFHYDSGEKKL